jgi:amidase
MSSFSEYDQFDGIGIAELVRGGKISAREVCEEAISRAEVLNQKLNAIILPLYDMARETAKGHIPEAPFMGVPFLLKDVHHALKGVVMSSGSETLRNFVPNYDAEIVKRFKNAGVNILGKTNTPEFKLAYVTEPKAFGPTRNPWNPDYTPGGSSGGSAAAVAARIVPIASATDEGGSIRVPASCCGLFGLKPSRGRNPVGPDFDEEWDGMSCSHVITRSVRDSAAMLDAVCGPENGAPYGIATPERPFLDELRFEPGRLRIGFHARSAFGRNVHPECVKAVEQACKLLEGLGHDVEEIHPDYQEEDAALNWAKVMIGNEAVLVDKLVRTYGRSKIRHELELTNYALYKVGRRMKALDFVKAKRRWRQFGTIIGQVMNKYDMMLTPTLGEPPVPVGSQQPGKADQFFMKLISSWAERIILSSQKLTYSILRKLIQKMMEGQMPFTMIANITGQPAMSVPLHWTEEGLPCGVQFIGRYGDEATLLRLAGQLEKAQPWIGRKPHLLK